LKVDDVASVNARVVNDDKRRLQRHFSDKRNGI